MSLPGRSKYRRATKAAALLAVGALLLTACGGSDDSGDDASGNGQSAEFNAAVDQVFRPTSEATGGTLRVGLAADCDSWDPQRTYYGACWNLQRLFTRSLMAYAGEPGAAGNEVVPDLAESAGEPNDDLTQWTYTLREGVTWDDGTPITSQDVKYGIERTFASQISGGPEYHKCLLTECDDEGASPFPGPYQDKGGLDSIGTPDDRTIVFDLVAPYAGWDFLMAFPAAAPVPADRDTRGRYTRDPASSGPFVITDYKQDRSVRFERNENWSQDTDDVRTPLVDVVELSIVTDSKALDQRLEAGTIDVPGDGPVQPALQGKIDRDPALNARADNPSTPFSRWIGVSPAVAPFDDVHCRRAVAYALNKADLLRARGGEFGGEIATVVLPPSVPGHDDEADRYPSGPDMTGDLDEAKRELEECGQPDGFTTRMAFPARDERNRNLFNATQSALDRVGIKVEAAPSAPPTYFSTYVGSQETVKDQGLGLQIQNWAPDFPQPWGFWNQIASGDLIRPINNYNWGLLDVPEINDALTEMTRATDQGEQSDLGQKVDELVMEEAVYIPYVHDKVMFLRSDRVVNTYVLEPLGGWYDFVNMGVQG